MDFMFLAELTINGALVGLMYGLVALGIVLIYKASGVANMAQGGLTMLGGYFVWWFSALLNAPIWLATLIAMLAMFLVGRLVERAALRRMVGQPVIMVLMLTFGLEIIMRGAAPIVFGSAMRRLDLGLTNAPVVIGDILLNKAYLLGGLISLILIVLSLFFFTSRQGIILRAVSDDQTAAWSVGISVERAVGVAWGLAGIAAAGAGLVWGSVQGVDWNLSLVLLKAVAVAILGGFDSIAGVLVAGVVLGVLESVIPAYVDGFIGGGSRDVLGSLVILMTMLVRPYGFFGRADIERI